MWQQRLEPTEPPALSQAASLALRELQLYTWSFLPAVFKINVQILFIIQHPQTAAARWPGSWASATSKGALDGVVFHKELEFPVVTWSVLHLIPGVAAGLAWTPLGSIKQMKCSAEPGELSPLNHAAARQPGKPGPWCCLFQRTLAGRAIGPELRTGKAFKNRKKGDEKMVDLSQPSAISLISSACLHTRSNGFQLSPHPRGQNEASSLILKSSLWHNICKTLTALPSLVLPFFGFTALLMPNTLVDSDYLKAPFFCHWLLRSLSTHLNKQNRRLQGTFYPSIFGYTHIMSTACYILSLYMEEGSACIFLIQCTLRSELPLGCPTA